MLEPCTHICSGRVRIKKASVVGVLANSLEELFFPGEDSDPEAVLPIEREQTSDPEGIPDGPF